MRLIGVCGVGDRFEEIYFLIGGSGRLIGYLQYRHVFVFFQQRGGCRVLGCDQCQEVRYTFDFECCDFCRLFLFGYCLFDIQ